MMAADTMEALGIARGQYVVKVNNRKILDGAMEAIGLGGNENAGRRLVVLRAFDKLDRLGVEGVRQLLSDGRKDESGDYTKGAGLDNEIISRIGRAYRFFTRDWKKAFSIGVYKRYLRNFVPFDYPSELIDRGLDELDDIRSLVRAAGYGPDRIHIDPSVVRGLEYYTGPVYEVELLLETKDEKGRPVRFGSVGGGGRYDGLVSRFRGEPVPATGFSIGVSRLQAALTLIGKLDSKPVPGPVVVTVFDRNRMADYQKMVAVLRSAGIRAELYLGNPKNMGNQFKYADRRNSPCVVIQGGDEKAKGEVQIKDLIEGTEKAIFHSAFDIGHAEYKAKRLAQFAVPEDELVDAVRHVLARHNVTWD
jgi:histidyl-tRNA synthetase